jgi:hypothetical protein
MPSGRHSETKQLSSLTVMKHGKTSSREKHKCKMSNSSAFTSLSHSHPLPLEMKVADPLGFVYPCEPKKLLRSWIITTNHGERDLFKRPNLKQLALKRQILDFENINGSMQTQSSLGTRIKSSCVRAFQHLWNQMAQ